MSDVLAGRRVLHLTTTDMSLAWLLGPQLRAFADLGMEVIGASAPGPFVAELESAGIRHEPVRHFTRSVSVGHDLQAGPELVRLFRRLRPDIVHTHNPKPGLLGRVAARAVGVPSVVNTVHGLYAAPEDPWPRRMAVYGVERLAAACSDRELVQNPEDVEVLRRLRVPAGRLVLLGNGVDLQRFRPATGPEARAEVRRELGLPADAVVVGTVGRLVWQKGYRELFSAAAALRRTHPEVHLVVVGPEDQAKGDALGPADLEQARASAHVTFLGHRDDVERLYHGFDLFVLASYREGFPRSAMEAAACGVPVIATDIRGCRQAVDPGQTGLLVPLHDADALAAAIADLARDPGRRAAMAEAARAKAEGQFDDQQIIQRTVAAYTQLLSDGRRRRFRW